MYVLDTNAISALMKGEPAVVERLAAVSKADVTLPQPAISEIAFGLARLPKSKRRARLQQKFDLLRREIARVEWTDAVSDAFGSVKASLERRGERIEDFDAAIAAHAIATKAVLVTADRRHMLRVPGLTIEDWAEGVIRLA